MKLSTTLRNAIVDAVVDAVDVGGGGRIEIRTGAAPTNVSDADSGTLLAVLTFSATAFGAASSGVATANTITEDSSINATGTAGHYRVKRSDGTVIWQGDVGTSGADINFNSTSFVAGGPCRITSMTVTGPT